MLGEVENTTLTPSRFLSPPCNASPSPSQTFIPSPQAQATSHTSLAPPTGDVEKKKLMMHKSELNCYCQKLGIQLPLYQTSIEGSCGHGFRFRSTVSVGKRSFTSSNTFANRKSAEQDVAKLALEQLVTESEATATNLRLYLRKDKARCKMILNEFSAKMKMECKYETVQVQSPPVFVSTVTLNGSCYKGEAGKSKKEAEQLAALVAIHSFLDDPTYATPISKVIKSKFNVCADFYEAKDIPSTRDCSVTGNVCKIVTPLNQQASSIEQGSFRVLVNGKTPASVNLQANNIEKQVGSGILINKNKQDLVSSLPHTEMIVNKNKQDLVNSSPETEKQGGHGIFVDKQGGDGQQTEAVTASRCSYVSLPITSKLFSEPRQEIKSAETSQPGSQQISVPMELFVLPAGPSPACETISSKKRRRNKKKTNKRLRAE